MYSAVLRRSGNIATALKKSKLPIHKVAMFATSSEAKQSQFETLTVTVPKPFVYHVELNRPKKLNAMNKTMWTEIGQCFGELGDNADCRAIVLSGSGKGFTAGLDLSQAAELGSILGDLDDVARRCKALYTSIKVFQDAMSSLEKCLKPIISATHNCCIGAGVDLITAADIRYCTDDAWFQVKEVDIGMAADVGTLQRLPKIIGSASLVRELSFTARKLLAPEAKQCGLVSKTFDCKESMVAEALDLAAVIASKSPVAIQVTKMSLVYSRDHTVQEGLDNIRHWNMAMLQSEDFMNAAMAQATKSPPPTFSKL